MAQDDENDDDAVVRGYRNYLVFCDESGIHGTPHYGWGTLWVPLERRGDLQRILRDLKDRHAVTGEAKWSRIKGHTVPFYQELIDNFFQVTWLMFHALVVEVAHIDRTKHKDVPQARLKHLSMLLRKKVQYFGRAGGRVYHVRVDPLPSSYDKEDEKLLAITNAMLVDGSHDLPPLASIKTLDSASSAGVQLVDVLLGAVMAGIRSDLTGRAKSAVVAHVADRLGWPDMNADTWPGEWKFNVWRFYNPVHPAPRDAETRRVKLRFPLPPFRPRVVTPRPRVSTENLATE